MEQRKPEVVIRLAVVRIRVLPGETLQCLAEMPFRLAKTSSPQQQETVCIVDADISLIPLQAFQIIRVREVSRMAVLFDMLSCQEELLIGHDFFRILCRLCRLRCLRDPLLFRLVIHEEFSVCIDSGTDIRRLLRPEADCLLIDIHRREDRIFPIDLVPSAAQDNLCILVPLCAVNRQSDLTFRDLHIHDSVDRGVLHRPYLFIRHKILLEHLFLKRLQPGEIRLIICIHTGHQLNVRTVLIRKVPVPGFAEVAAPPCPLLFPRRDMVVRHMQDARLSPVIIAADKVIVRLFCHIGGRNRNVFIA